MKSRVKILPLLVSFSLLSSGARATVILTGEGDFTLPGLRLTFELFPSGLPVPFNADNPGLLRNQWSGLGVVISDDSPANGAGAYSGTYDVLPHSGGHALSDSDGSLPGGALFFDFRHPVSGVPAAVAEAGLWVQNGDSSPTSVSFYTTGGLLLQTISVGKGDTFVGLRADEGIGRIGITDAEYYLVDDLQFATIPEPGAPLLVASALAAGLRFRRRRL